MQLTDKAFYSTPVVSEPQPIRKYLASSAQVFDYIMRMAQAQDDNPISQLAAQFAGGGLSFDQFMQSAQQNGIPDHVIQVVLRSMGGYIAEGKSRAEVEADAVMYIETYAMENNLANKQAQVMAKAYRVITDEPQGICIGFIPDGVESDEYDLVSDDGGQYVRIDGHNLSIISDQGQATEPELMIWRTPEQFNLWMQEIGLGQDHEAQGGANMLAPQQSTDQQVPVQDKVQQYKDIGLNDQQIEQVMKTSSGGDQPAGTAANPMDGQRDSLSQPEVEGTGKIGQQMPPAPLPAPGAPPGAPAPGSGPELPATDIPDGVEDTRTLQEAVEDLKEDVNIVTEKIENGETILGGENMVPVTTDTGAVPSPAPMVAAEERVAVDQAAKEYFSDYYGSYGDQLTHDRVAEIIDMVEEVARQYKTKLTTAQVGKIATFVNHGGVDGNLSNHPKLEAILDLNLINYLFKTGMIQHIDDFYQEELLSRNLRQAAIFKAPAIFQAKIGQWYHEIRAIHTAEFNKQALPKMKQPSVKGQPDDAVKVDEIGDNADKEDRLLARPAHLPMEVIDQEVSGAYLKLMIEWDPKHDAANQSADGLKQSVLSFVKGLESKKEFVDYGFLGQISFDEFKPKDGMATVSVRTKKPGDAPGHVKTTPKKKEGQIKDIFDQFKDSKPITRDDLAPEERCNCENSVCSHSPGLCNNAALNGFKAIYIGPICARCADFMPKKYLLPPYGTAR
jgi:hypothetical protein